MAAQGGYWYAGRWWASNWWESNWFNGDQSATPSGDGEAAALVWELRRRKRKQPEQITRIQLPPLAALLAALED